MAFRRNQRTPNPSRTRHTLAPMFAAFLIAGLTFAAPYVSADRDKEQNKKKESAAAKAVKGLPVTELSSDETILHALNRLGYGPRPGDLDRVRKMGLESWINQQLNPQSLDDSALQARLNRYSTISMSTTQLYTDFPQPTPVQRKALQEEAQRRQEQRTMSDANGDAQDDNDKTMEGAAGKPGKQGGAGGNLKEGQAFSGGDPNNPQYARLMEGKLPQRIVAELSMAKLTRAIYSEHQLEEQMVDFWFNHFNVFAGKGQDRWMLTSYERDVIRPHVLGKFRDLLEATAKSPAMLFYLDNWMSVDPEAWARLQQLQAQRRGMRGFGNGPFGFPGRFPPQNPNANGQQGQANKKQERGLNENYARELMELHTLGVDGGYTQQDVIEVAKCFTGWTMKNPRQSPNFTFDERLHDNSTKTVLGHEIHAGGERDGEEVLDLLVHEPATARFISTKLARHFVSDTPPQALVDRMTKTFQETDGDIRAVLHTMIYSPEFWSKTTIHAKIKTPFELVVSATRALGADLDVALPLVMWTARIGEPLYQCQPPTGYKDTAETWVNTGALLNRLNFSLSLATNRLRGARTDVAALFGQDATGDPLKALDRAIDVLLSNQVSPQTRATLEKQLSDPQVLQAKLDDPVKQIDLGTVAGLVLGAPEFQRR
jgi:uncharacterized protein (DUF1800 family)